MGSLWLQECREIPSVEIWLSGIRLCKKTWTTRQQAVWISRMGLIRAPIRFGAMFASLQSTHLVRR